MFKYNGKQYRLLSEESLNLICLLDTTLERTSTSMAAEILMLRAENKALKENGKVVHDKLAVSVEALKKIKSTPWWGSLSHNVFDSCNEHRSVAAEALQKLGVE